MERLRISGRLNGINNPRDVNAADYREFARLVWESSQGVKQALDPVFRTVCLSVRPSVGSRPDPSSKSLKARFHVASNPVRRIKDAVSG